MIRSNKCLADSTLYCILEERGILHPMPMSTYYRQLREKIGSDLIFSPSVAAIIRNRDQEVLFVQSATDLLWSIPAGAIELGETPAEAIRREVFEETGLTVRPLRILGVVGGRDFRWTYLDGNRVEYLTVVFECQVESGELSAIDGEVAAFQYCSHQELPALQFSYPHAWFDGTAQEAWFQDPESAP